MKNKNLLIIKYFIEKKKSTKLNGIIPTTSKFNTQQSGNALTPTTYHREESKNRIKAEHKTCTQNQVITCHRLVQILNPFL